VEESRFCFWRVPIENSSERVKVLSLYWGFSIGGVAKYAQLIDGVKHYRPVSVRHVCILNDRWHCDESTLSKLNPYRTMIRSRFDISWFWRVAGIIRDESPDIIFSHGFNGHLVVLVLRLFGRLRPRSVVSYHGLYHPVSAGRRLVAPIYNWFTEHYCRRWAYQVLSVTEFSMHYLLSRRLPPGKITVIHNGIPDLKVAGGSRSELRRKWGIGENDFVIGSTSRLDEVKGLSFLIEAFQSVAAKLPHLRLVMVGTGTIEADLRRCVSEKGLTDRAVFTGFRSDIPACLDAFDLFVLPSLAEYHSIALLEAMRAGKPIIATSVGGNTESVRDGTEALVVKPGDAAELAKAIERLTKDPGERRSIGAGARRRYLEEFRDSVMVQRTADWLMNCATRPAGR